jgi:hypothetical protein
MATPEEIERRRAQLQELNDALSWLEAADDLQKIRDMVLTVFWRANLVAKQNDTWNNHNLYGAYDEWEKMALNVAATPEQMKYAGNRVCEAGREYCNKATTEIEADTDDAQRAQELDWLAAPDKEATYKHLFFGDAP